MNFFNSFNNLYFDEKIYLTIFGFTVLIVTSFSVYKYFYKYNNLNIQKNYDLYLFSKNDEYNCLDWISKEQVSSDFLKSYFFYLFLVNLIKLLPEPSVITLNSSYEFYCELNSVYKSFKQNNFEFEDFKKMNLSKDFAFKLISEVKKTLFLIN